MIEQKSAPKGIGFSVDRSLFVGVKGWDQLPERLEGNFVSWMNKSEKRVEVHYPKEAKADGSIPEDVFMLHKLLAHGFRYELGEKNRPRPVRDVRAALRASPRDAGGGAAADEADNEEADDAERRYVDIKYEEGSVMKEQRWYYEKPEAIKKDAGPEKRPASINRQASAVDTPWKMIINAAMPPRLVKGLLHFFNERLDDSDTDHRQTTLYGEVLVFLSSLPALCLVKGVPLKDCWSETEKPGDLFPPLRFGRHGISKHRWKILRGLAGAYYPVSEEAQPIFSDWANGPRFEPSGYSAGGRSTFSTTTTPSYSTRRRSSDLTSSCRRTMGRSRRRALLSS